jgi:hypothetical protein
MNVVFFIIIFFILFYFVLKRRKSIKKQDSLAIYQEVEKDFEEDFERDANGNLTIQGMTDLVEWFEDDLRTRRVLKSDEIKDFEELK